MAASSDRQLVQRLAINCAVRLGRANAAVDGRHTQPPSSWAPLMLFMTFLNISKFGGGSRLSSSHYFLFSCIFNAVRDCHLLSRRRIPDAAASSSSLSVFATLFAGLARRTSF